MRLEDMREQFPKMPESMKQMIEQQKQYDKNMELLEEMKKKKKAEASK